MSVARLHSTINYCNTRYFDNKQSSILIEIRSCFNKHTHDKSRDKTRQVIYFAKFSLKHKINISNIKSINYDNYDKQDNEL